MAWMEGVTNKDQWEWDYKQTNPNDAAARAAKLTKQFKVPVFFRKIPDEQLWECYTSEPLEVPREEHSNLCRCKLCYTPPK